MREFREPIKAQDAKKEKSVGVRIKDALRWLIRCAGLWIGSLLTAWLLFLSFPKRSYAVLAWLALAPFIWGVTKIRGFWSSFFYSWITGFLFHAGVLYWVYYTCVHGGGLSASMAQAAWLGLSALLSIQFAFWGGCCFYLKRTGPFFPALAACGFVTLEWLHQTIAFYGLGFPWLMFGYTQWNWPEMLQIASLTGVYGISFALAFVGTSIGWAFSISRVKPAVGHMLLAAGVFMSIFWWGHVQLAQDQAGASSKSSLLSLQAVLVQPNIDQYKKWDEAFEEEIFNTLTVLGDEVASAPARLAIWPESTLPGSLEEARYAHLFEDIASKSGAYQLLGSNINTALGQYVGAYLMPPSSQDWQEYRKIKLVPFGEYIPFEKQLRSLFSDIEVLGELGGFQPGSREQKLLDLGGVPLGISVCYESIFPQLWQVQNKQGAKLFVNITNDAWFFDTDAPYQHLAINVLRAVETGRPVLRAANTGFSAVISPFGKIEQQTKLFTRTLVRQSIPLSLGDQVNIYTQWGDWFAWVCAALFFTLFISTVVFAYE